jgi:hypothetical protein
LTEPTTGEYKTYVCSECLHEVTASSKPDPIHWTDGHVCKFTEVLPRKDEGSK